MPLSEEELRLLEQMERALVEEDPKFASTLRGTALRRTARRRVIAAGLVFAVGIALLMTGAIVQVWFVGVAGFLVMLAAATVGLSSLRSQQAAGEQGPAPAPGVEGMPGLTALPGGRDRSRGKRPGRSRNRGQGTFMERMEQRWRRRREGGGY